MGTSREKIHKGRREDFDELTIFQIRNLQIGEMVRLFILQIEVVVSFILELVAAFAMFWLKVFALLSPYLIFFILFVFVFWMAHVWWPYTIKLVIYVLIPILDLAIIAFNIIFKIVAFIYMLLAIVWNAIVPFLGMLLYFIFDLILTILDLVNQILGDLDLPVLFNDLMQIINVIMEIVLQIVQVLIKIGAPTLQVLAKVIAAVIQVIMTVVKAILPIMVFLFRVIYYTVNPILKLIVFFFSGGQTNTFGKKLLSINIMGQTYRDDYHATSYDPYAEFVMSTLSMTPSALYTEIHQNDTALDDLWSAPEMTGRRPLAYKQRKAGLAFLDEDEEDEEEEVVQRGKHDDDITYGFAHTFYKSAKETPPQMIHESQDIMDQIMYHQNRQDPLLISSILTTFNKEHGHLEAPYEERLGAIRYASQQEHPNELSERLKQERIIKRAEIMSGTGRKMLDLMAFPDNANEHLNHYMSNLEREHAIQVMQQAQAYKDQHVQRMKFITVVASGVSTTMRKHAETTFHPDTIMGQWEAVLQQMGFEDVWDWHRQFLEQHGDAAGFIMSLSSFFQHPFFEFVKKSETPDPNSPYFHDWAAEQARLMGGENTGGRRLFAATADNSVDHVGISRSAFGGFATISKKNCVSKPKHPLCAPVPPTSIFSWGIPTLILTDKQKSQLLEDIKDCTPWIPDVYCFVCIERVYNTLVEILFLIVAIPPINYALATLTRIAPWTGFFLDWMFIVPKFKRATTFQWICFIYELWNPFIVFLILALLYYFFWPVVLAFYHAFRSILVIKARKPEPTGDIDALDAYFAPIIANPPPIPPPGLNPTTFIEGGINIHHHHNYRSEEDQRYAELLERVNRYTEREDRLSDRYHLLMAEIARNHLRLHVNHTDRIDDVAAQDEEMQLRRRLTFNG